MYFHYLIQAVKQIEIDYERVNMLPGDDVVNLVFVVLKGWGSSVVLKS